jgi:hypothetical protein
MRILLPYTKNKKQGLELTPDILENIYLSLSPIDNTDKKMILHALEKQKINRLFCMIAAAQTCLVNYPMEFWHFSYGDCMATYWNNKIGEENKAVYGLVEAENLDISLDESGHLKVTILTEKNIQTSSY